MTIDRKKDPLFVFLLEEARELGIEAAEECFCLKCLIEVIEIFWENKRNAAELDLQDKLIKLSNLTNKLLEYILKLNLEESQRLLRLNDELKAKVEELELERTKIEVQKNAEKIKEQEEINNYDYLMR